MGTTIKLTAKDGHDFDAYRADHQGERKGGLVLIQEIFGVTPHIQTLCDAFAADGYDVIAPAIFDRIERGASFGYSSEEIEASVKLAGESGVETPMLDIQACVDALAADGPVAITGFCYGGSLTWMAAAHVNGLACAVGYYGRLIPDHLDVTLKCPTMLHFGSRDTSIPLTRVRDTAEAYGDVKVHIYRAEHGFCSDREANYDETACALARERTLAFFADHMG